MKARVHITLKNGVLDPQGKAIENALGGMGFSRLFETTGDLALVILIHWAVTFLNTPSAPREKSLIVPGS
mgnify:CR=1 FL=1